MLRYPEHRYSFYLASLTVVSVMRFVHLNFQEKCIKFREEADKADTENVKICKVLDELRVGVSKLFKVTSLCIHLIKEYFYFVKCSVILCNINIY